MLAGLGWNNKPVWSMSISPMMSTVSAKKTETCRRTTYVPHGTLKKIEKVWLRIVGDF
jgi:hypothetical protein